MLSIHVRCVKKRSPFACVHILVLSYVVACGRVVVCSAPTHAIAMRWRAYEKERECSYQKKLSYSTLPTDRYPLLHHCASP